MEKNQMTTGFNLNIKPLWEMGIFMIMWYLSADPKSYNELFKTCNPNEEHNIAHPTLSGKLKKLVKLDFLKKEGKNNQKYALSVKSKNLLSEIARNLKNNITS